jgi:hypothetical protein
MKYAISAKVGSREDVTFLDDLVVRCCKPCRDELLLAVPYAYMFPSLQRVCISLLMENGLMCLLNGLNTLLKTLFFELFLELCSLN